MEDVQQLLKQLRVKNQVEYLWNTTSKTEHHIRNSIEIELLMSLEDQGLGHWSITTLLNHLQDMVANGETQSFYVLKERRKLVDGNEDEPDIWFSLTPAQRRDLIIAYDSYRFGSESGDSLRTGKTLLKHGLVYQTDVFDAYPSRRYYYAITDKGVAVVKKHHI